MRTQLAKLAELRTGKSSRLPPTAPVPCPCLGMAAGAYPHSAGRPSLWRVTGTFLPATRGHDPGREECQPSARSRVRGRLNRAAGDAGGADRAGTIRVTAAHGRAGLAVLDFVPSHEEGSKGGDIFERRVENERSTYVGRTGDRAGLREAMAPPARGCRPGLGPGTPRQALRAASAPRGAGSERADRRFCLI